MRGGQWQREQGKRGSGALGHWNADVTCVWRVSGRMGRDGCCVMRVRVVRAGLAEWLTRTCCSSTSHPLSSSVSVLRWAPRHLFPPPPPPSIRVILPAASPLTPTNSLRRENFPYNDDRALGDRVICLIVGGH